MIESEQVQEWINMGVVKGEAMGEVRGEANALLRLLAKRFPPGAPADLTVAIRADTNLDRLRNWFDLALTVDSIEVFRQTISL